MTPSAAQRPHRRRDDPTPLRPTRGAQGEVRWWERPAPEGSDPALWQAVQRLQSRRLQLRISVQELARRLRDAGHPLRRETLSRVLNGKQPTTWATVRSLAEVLGVDVDDGGPQGAADEDHPLWALWLAV